MALSHTHIRQNYLPSLESPNRSYFENRIPLKPALGEGGGVCSLANYSVAYEVTQSNRVSDFRDFVCSLFPKAIFSDLFDPAAFRHTTKY